MKPAALLLSIAVVLLFAGCSAPPASDSPSPSPAVPGISEIIAAGSVNGTAYTNSILGITCTLPEGWTPDLQQESGTEETGCLLRAGTPGETETASIQLQVVSEAAAGGASVMEYAVSLADAFEEECRQLGMGTDTEPFQDLIVDESRMALVGILVTLDGNVGGYVFNRYQVAQVYSVYDTGGAVVVGMLSAFDDEKLEEGMDALKSVSFSS